jgi:hypothetical protein
LNVQDVPGTPLPDFFRDRGFALLDALVAAAVIAVLALIYQRLSKSTFLVRYSLRTRLTAALGVLALAALGGHLLRASPTVILISTFVGFALLVQWILRDLSNVGIMNAFETTEQGVSAEASLKEVQRELTFLGIGASKLTATAEFDKMLARCRAANGKLRFLLSHPENTALEGLATQNRRHSFSYRSRVKESIREIFTRATAAGVDFEVRLYNLNQKIALPHFRLVFIDDRLCIFSQVYWSDKEGLDNPQLILRRDKNKAGSSLYQGYRDYFEDLWDLDSTKKVDQATLSSWPA